MNTASANWRTPFIVLVAGCLISLTGFGIRSSFGLFLEPMTVANDWSRETFGLAMALQNLMWGIGLPVAGALADKHGSVKVIIFGTIMYALGVWGMAEADSGFMLQLTGGVLTGLGIAFSAFTLAMAAMVRVVGPEKRSFVLGVGTAAGSFGQVVFSPISQGFISAFGWHTALLLLASISLVMIPMAMCLPKSAKSVNPDDDSDQTLRDAVREALGHRGYVLLTVGFFVCGFHVTFIGVFLPGYAEDGGLSPSTASTALALIGLFNVAGSLIVGVLGQRMRFTTVLAWIYGLRAVVIAGYILVPLSATSTIVFSMGMGLLWLATVPMTSAIVTQQFGPAHAGALFGIVFLSHQLGSFVGAFLGGVELVVTFALNTLDREGSRQVRQIRGWCRSEQWVRGQGVSGRCWRCQQRVCGQGIEAGWSGRCGLRQGHGRCQSCKLQGCSI